MAVRSAKKQVSNGRGDLAKDLDRIETPNGTVVMPRPGVDGEKKALAERITIPRPNMQVIELGIIGTAPLVINRFSQKAIEQMKQAQMAGSQGKKGKQREPKNFEECYENSKHVSTQGWCGFAAPAIRCAMVDVCRLVNFKMTLAKLAIFVLQDGFDRVDATPLIKITVGEPHKVEHAVRNESGVADIRARACWDAGWEAVVRLRFDADIFSKLDVANLLARVGMQAGIGEGRPNSKNSTGQGWGLFDLKSGM